MSASHDPTAKTKSRTRVDPPENVDVAIIGAGTGGLTAGAYLARQGLKVAVFDSHYVAGGCATQFQRGPKNDRYRFDVGLHYVGDCGESGLFSQVLGPLGIEPEWLPLDPDGFDTLIFPDFRFRIPVDRGLYRDRLVELFPDEKRGIDKYIKFLRQLDRVVAVMEGGGGKGRVALEVLFRAWGVGIHQNSTIETFLDKCTKNPKLRAVLLGQHGDYAVPPSEASALLHAGLTNHYFKGAFYPKGGGQVISDALADTIEANGGAVLLRRGIAEIIVENGRAVGVRTEERRGVSHVVRAHVVVSNADLMATCRDLIPADELPASWVKKSEDWTMGGALFMTFLGVRGDMASRGMSNCNYWSFDDYDTEAYYQSNRGDGPVEIRGTYITSASFKDPDTVGHAPEGIKTVEVMAVVPGDAPKWKTTWEEVRAGKHSRNQAYLDEKQRVEDELVDRADRLFPGLKDDIVFRESASPMTHSFYTRASAGSGYGLAATPEQFNDRRPGFRGPLPGLYLCGGSTRAGHGIAGALRGGQLAAKTVLRDLGRTFDDERGHAPREQ
jgi:all-trans-retinol 13,14-reductase